MPTEEEKQAEKERVTRISGFRVGAHDFLAEVDFDALKARNDRWEAQHRDLSREERKHEELSRRNCLGRFGIDGSKVKGGNFRYVYF